MARRPGIIYIWRLSARYGWDASSTPSSLIYQVALLLLVIHPRHHLVNIFRTNLPPCRLFSWPSFYPPPSPPIHPLPWLPGHPPPWPICHTPFRPLHHRLEICQKNYTTGFLVQKFYTLKVRKSRRFFIGPRSDHSLRMSLTDSLTTLLKIEWSDLNTTRCQLWCTIELHRDPISKVLSEW